MSVIHSLDYFSLFSNAALDGHCRFDLANPLQDLELLILHLARFTPGPIHALNSALKASGEDQAARLSKSTPVSFLTCYCSQQQGQ